MFSTLPALNIIKNGVVLILGSFSIDNGHGNENLTFTMNSRFSKFCRVYSNSLKMSHVGEFSRSWVLRDHTHLSSLVYLHRVVSRRSRATTAKKCTKKRDARAKLLFCLINNNDCFGFMVLENQNGQETVRSTTFQKTSDVWTSDFQPDKFDEFDLHIRRKY